VEQGRWPISWLNHCKKHFKTSCKDDCGYITQLKQQISNRRYYLAAHHRVVNVLTLETSNVKAIFGQKFLSPVEMAVTGRTPQKMKTDTKGCTQSHMHRNETPYPICIKLCMVVGISAVITHASFVNGQLRGFGVAFPIYIHRRPYNTLARPYNTLAARCHNIKMPRTFNSKTQVK